MKSKDQQLLEEAYSKVEEGTFSDKVRAWNYKRLANRSFKKAEDALEKTHDYDWTDPDREEHEKEFSKQMNTTRQREKKAKELSKESVESEEKESFFKDKLDHYPVELDPEVVANYWNALKKFENDEITSQQWYDVCAKLLGDIMEQNKDVFVRLKDR